MPTPPPSRRKRRRALELLETSLDGCTEAIMLAHGFKVELQAWRTRSRLHSTKADNGIPIVTTSSSVSVALLKQLIFEYAALSSCPMNCTDFLRNLMSIRTAILHYLNNYRTIAATDAKASAQELWRALNLWRARKLLRHASGRNCNQKASGESIEGHELHS